MQDNALIYIAALVQRWLREMSVEVLEWPPYSADLNLIENIWPHLKNGLYKAKPDIENYSKGDALLLNVMAEVLQISWLAIQERIFDACINSMPRRLKVVRRARDWYTKY